MAAFPTLDDATLAGKRVLVREDLNVPMEGGRVTDVTRLERVVANIQEIAKKRGKVILLSHLGRPKGKPDPRFTLKPIAAALAGELGKPVAFAPDCIGPEAEKAVAAMKDGDVLILENTRFHAGEEKNDPEFVAALAKLGDVYVNDAFSAAHRAHASTEGLARKLPAYAGRTMQGELDMLATMLATPQHPVAAIVGGAKVSTKLELLGNLLQTVDILMIGGGMANTFLAAAGTPIGKSLQEADLAETARNIARDAKAKNCRIVLPVDAVVATKLEPGVASRTVAIEDVGPDEMILDIGPKSVAAIAELLRTAKTLVWNGPFGVFEVPPFDAGTSGVAKVAADLTKTGGLKTIAGGGDTIAALNHAGVIDDFTYVSTAGGAFLEWLEGKLLPGVEALRNADYVL